ncbi:DNA transposition protein [Roseospira marina]|uniref:DNA transposition protein n=1 Tax=Roseospira marina TaxID=140057 RepID=A0A5M6I7G2_9PROT|nr:DNA transposition protein [Roseospira marina]KAA5603748.1 DNA transposition protein [Roseospira marina]MBB4316062.1 hypothetical protein [Roseospira marina]MBB5089220.1 hypothetical protein [Roseospira marina]
MGRDTRTLDLFTDWQPRDPVERYAPEATRAASLRDRISRAVAVTLKECDQPRETVAEAMSAYLGEEVSKNMLDAYASQGRGEHTIPFLRVIALWHVTGDARLMQLGAEEMGHAVIDQHFLPWVEVGQLADTKTEVDRAYDMARRLARRPGR